MKYCSHCGSELLDEAALCPKCGCMVNEIVTTTTVKEKLKTNVCALIGFILSLASALFFTNPFGLLALAGLILSIIGLIQIGRDSTLKGKGFAITGIIVGSIFFLYGALLYFIIFVA